jgi:aspartate racemase
VSSEESGAIIPDTYSKLAREGAVTQQERAALVAIAGRLVDRGAEAIVLAATALALLFDDTNTPFPYLDCARAHIQAIMRAVLGE